MSQTRVRILLVDDNSEQNDAFRSGVWLMGIQTDTYNDPIEAIKNFRAGLYDLVLLDMQMPRMADSRCTEKSEVWSRMFRYVS